MVGREAGRAARAPGPGEERLRGAKSVAYAKKADVDRAYGRMMRALLLHGTCPAIATHDPAMIAEAKQTAAEHDIARDGFEFQMLFGIRRDLQAALVQEGYRLRIYVPYGREWFPYFMHRLGERPANALFVARSLMAERYEPVRATPDGLLLVALRARFPEDSTGPRRCS